jgi:hypothetical protein
MNARAQYLTAPVAIGTTVAGTSEYSLGETFIDLAAVRVGGVRYERVSPNEMWDLEDSGSGVTLSGRGGVYAPDWSSTGGAKIQISPTPESDGDAIEGREVIRLPAPTDWATEDPPLPEDVDDGILHGAVAKGLSLQDEALNEAEWHETRFEQAVVSLKTRKHSRIGSGGVRIRLGNIGR